MIKYPTNESEETVPQPLKSRILSKIAHTITIETNPDYFEFRLKDRKIRLKTCVLVRLEADGELEIIEFGTEQEGTGTRVLYLFKENDWMDDSSKQVWTFVRFLQHGIKALLPTGRAVFRPIVHFTDVYSFDHLFMGYQFFLFSELAFSAGTREVYFSELDHRSIQPRKFLKLTD